MSNGSKPREPIEAIFGYSIGDNMSDQRRKDTNFCLCPVLECWDCFVPSVCGAVHRGQKFAVRSYKSVLLAATNVVVATKR